MTNTDEAAAFVRVRDYYRALVEKYGHDPRACDYGRAESQLAKFDVIATAIRGRRDRVLDVGCGFGDFLTYLRHRGLDVEYTGIDISEAMVEQARRHLPDARILLGNFLDAPVTGEYDIVTANGIFYLLGSNAEALMHRLVTRMFSLAQRTVVFNSLSSWAPDPQPGEFYADPSSVLSFCRSLTPWVTLRHDYHPRDFTVFLHKRKPE